ncbi:MAG: hypothetical protein AMXMBFR57_00850 [Acidimicrobiia bacterium]|jgi:hypothetical protein
MLTPDDRNAEILAAWVDGEASDRDDVLAALARPDCQAYVFDLMAIRRVVTITSPAALAAPVHAPRRWPRLLTAAAAAAVCIVSGYGIAQLANRSAPVNDAGRAGVSTEESSAPQPTHVIRFETGVDWRETAGGN